MTVFLKRTPYITSKSGGGGSKRGIAEDTMIAVDTMEHRQIKLRILDYLYDLVGHHEILESNGEKLRAKILNRLPHKVPSYLFDEIEIVANNVEGKIFAALLFVMGIFHDSGKVMEQESFVYLKNKAELQGSGRTLFN